MFNMKIALKAIALIGILGMFATATASSFTDADMAWQKKQPAIVKVKEQKITQHTAAPTNTSRFLIADMAWQKDGNTMQIKQKTSNRQKHAINKQFRL